MSSSRCHFSGLTVAGYPGDNKFLVVLYQMNWIETHFFQDARSIWIQQDVTCATHFTYFSQSTLTFEIHYFLRFTSRHALLEQFITTLKVQLDEVFC
uniref:Secreted protein n=1 Tax=Ascaris lumbricoides TaxID=6252 RepID=A0A0M3HGN1_ASCLU